MDSLSNDLPILYDAEHQVRFYRDKKRKNMIDGTHPNNLEVPRYDRESTLRMATPSGIPPKSHTEVIFGGETLISSSREDRSRWRLGDFPTRSRPYITKVGILRNFPKYRRNPPTNPHREKAVINYYARFFGLRWAANCADKLERARERGSTGEVMGGISATRCISERMKIY